MSLSAYLAGAEATLAATRAGGLDSAASRAIAVLTAAMGARRAVLIAGNGGSAADAMHIAGELVGRYRLERPGFKVIALGTDAAVTTAWSNDYAYDSLFARQVEALGEAEGVLMAISTSGNSPNILKAAEQARAMAMTVIGLTGRDGGRLAPLADILLAVPSGDTPRIQEVHTCLYHYLCEQVEQRLAGQG